MFRKILLSGLLFCCVIQLQAQHTHTAFQTIAESWIRGDIGTDEAASAFDSLQISLEEMEDSWGKYYWLARTGLILGQIYFDLDNKDLSINNLENCSQWIEKAHTYSEESDNLRIMSEAGSVLMLQKGFLYIIANFYTILGNANKALEIDPENIRAAFIVAQFLSNSPKIVGGNLNKGIDMYMNLLQRSDLSYEDRFVITINLYHLYINKKMETEAGYIYRTLVDQYPNNEKVIALPVPSRQKDK